MESTRRSRLGEDEGGDVSVQPLRYSLSRPISPPPAKRRRLANTDESPEVDPAKSGTELAGQSSGVKCVRSPFQLTKIRDLPPEANVDTVTLQDILGDPLVSECWEFNYLHDIDFLISAFDEDVRHLVKVHVVHGFWKREDPVRKRLQEAASRHKNVELHTAFMPEMYGTHHSKMMILIRRDDTAQVVIHTANMIIKDWTNMTQAVWRSPLLPLKDGRADEDEDGQDLKIGSGEKFKHDLLNYLRAYDTRQRIVCKPLIEKLAKYDFSAVRGALIASVPGKHSVRGSAPRWGWAAVKKALQSVPSRPGSSEVVIQISSIATLGPTDNWLQNVLFKAFLSGEGPAARKPRFKVVFPTADEIRKSLEGYGSGGSIHTKIQSAQQLKQLQYLKPMFHHWANDSENGIALGEDVIIQDAGRSRAAPHIKTFVKYSNCDSDRPTIDWALVTSANLSKQAWGEAASTSGEMRVSSYEIGVLVWPSLFGGDDAAMVPTFRTDHPPSVESVNGEGVDRDKTMIVGFRVPYNLPLQRYGKDEKPWVATMSYDEQDWMGQVWRHD